MVALLSRVAPGSHGPASPPPGAGIPGAVGQIAVAVAFGYARSLDLLSEEGRNLILAGRRCVGRLALG
jgi:hypothetical protein